MAKNQNKLPDVTPEALREAIRTYRRDNVSYLLKKNVLKQIPDADKRDIYRSLVALQSIEIMRAVAKEEVYLDPEIFFIDSDSSQSKNFIKACLVKYRRKFRYADDAVCDTLFTLAGECSCAEMARLLIHQGKVKNRYAELGCFSPDMLRLIREIAPESVPNDTFVKIYFFAATTSGHEEKMDFLISSGFNLFLKDESGKTVLDYLNERISGGKYPKNRQGSHLLIEDKKMAARLAKLLEKQNSEQAANPFSDRKVRIAVIAACVLVVAAVAALWYASSDGGDTADETVSTEEILSTEETLSTED